MQCNYVTLFQGIYHVLLKVEGPQPGQTPRVTQSPRRLVYRTRSAKERTTNNPTSTVGDATMIANNAPFSEQIEEGLHQDIATTGFTSDAGVVQATPLNPVNFTQLSKSATDDTIQDIKTFLQKPVVLATGTLGTLDSVSTFPAFNLPHAPIIANPTISRKLDGFLGFRAKMILRIQINANKFQQGRYMLTWRPTGGSPMTNTNTAYKTNAHAATLMQRSQLHRVELDLSHDTVGILEIPYSSALNFVPLTGLVSTGSLYGMLGVAQLFPYSSLVAPTGSTTASYTIWFSMEDVELIGAAAPQSGRFGSSSKRGRGSNPSEAEQRSAGMGPIGAALTKVSTASAMFKPVPLVGQFAGGLSWVSEIAAGAANIFGWCKPLNLEVPSRSIRETLPYVGNVDGPSSAQPLSLSYKNMVDTAVGFSGTTTDELDLKFISTIPAYWDAYQWTNLQSSGASIFVLPVTPTLYMNTRTDKTFPVTSYTPMAFVANQFAEWRGSLIYTLKFVKTEFHSGRIAVCFFPADTSVAGPASSYALSNYVHREIIDIREQTEVTFQVPYISSSPWRNTNAADNPTGNIVCYVVDPLVAPASVSSLITILLEVAGGPDLEFAVPEPQIFVPWVNATPQSGLGINKPSRDTDLYEGTLGASSVVDDATNSAAICIGEKVSSFRTLLKMSQQKFYAAASPTFNRYLNIIPFGTEVAVGSLTPVWPATAPDLYDIMSSIFVYSRGGIRYQITPNIDAAVVSQVPQTYLTTNSNAGNINVTSLVTFSASDGSNFANPRGRRNPVAYSNVQQNRGIEVQVPQYSKWHSRVNSEHYVAAGAPYNTTPLASLSTKLRMVTAFSTATPAYVGIARSCADDANFGLFVSIPEYYMGGGNIYNAAP